MTTEFDDDDPYLRPYLPSYEDDTEAGDDDLEDDEGFEVVVEEVDLEEAAAEFRMLYYGPDNNPEPPAAMMELAPEVMLLVDQVVYGEIYNRPAVDLRTRSLCTIAALVVLGHSPQMIKRHITGALHIGVSQEEISEIIAQMIFYGGMPAAVNAFRIAKETFDEQAARGSTGSPRAERPPRDTPSGYAPPYRRENVGDYGPEDLDRTLPGSGLVTPVPQMPPLPTGNPRGPEGGHPVSPNGLDKIAHNEKLVLDGLNTVAHRETGESRMRLGFIGTGNMGNPMAANLIRAGHQLTVHDLRREAATNLLEMGAEWADSPRAAVPGNDAVLTSLPVPRDVEAVVLGEDGILEGAAEGTVIFDLSTNSPTVVRNLHQECSARGVTLLDSPVSGGTYGAAAGTLAVMVGGDRGTFERFESTLGAIGSHVVYCGDIGAGSVCKICNNLTSMGIGVLLSETLTLGVKAGVDLATLADVIAHSSGSSRRLTEKFSRFLFQGNFEPGFATPWPPRTCVWPPILAVSTGCPWTSPTWSTSDTWRQCSVASGRRTPTLLPASRKRRRACNYAWTSSHSHRSLPLRGGLGLAGELCREET